MYVFVFQYFLTNKLNQFIKNHNGHLEWNIELTIDGNNRIRIDFLYIYIYTCITKNYFILLF